VLLIPFYLVRSLQDRRLITNLQQQIRKLKRKNMHLQQHQRQAARVNQDDLYQRYPILLLDHTLLNRLHINIQNNMDDNKQWKASISKNRQGRYPGTTLRVKGKATWFTCSHAILVAAKKMPKYGDEASHICHKSTCLDIMHLVWENAKRNRLRNICKQNHVCTCKLQPSCIFPH
jgi:hypothetical protein